MAKKRDRIALIFLSVLFQQSLVIGQIKLEEEPKMLYWEQTHRVKKLKDADDFRDVFHKDRYLLGKKRIYGNISYNAGRIMIDDENHIAHPELRSAIGFYTKVRFFEEFSFSTTFYKNLNRSTNVRWLSDYEYSIGRYNWRSNKFNYGYENYANNKYSDDLKTFGDKFLEGYYFISYSHSLAKGLTRKISLDSSTNLKFVYFVRYSIKYRDQFNVSHGSLFSGKPTLGGGLRITLYKNIYVESAVYFYFNPKVQQQPWDPDYSYGFGYFNYHSFRCSLTYANWAVNRFPWNESTAYSNYGFLDGNFRLVANWIW
jgi:hypothetical protein